MRISKNSSAASPLRGRVLITGGTSGIGLAFAKALAARGCALVLVARSQDRLESTKGELESQHGIECEILRADLSTEQGIADVTERLGSSESPIEVFVNNAGQVCTTSSLPRILSLLSTALTSWQPHPFGSGRVRERP